MTPTETTKLDDGGLDKARLQQIVTRLKGVRRRCVDDPAEANRQNKAIEGLDAVLANLDDWMATSAAPMDPGNLDLRLAAIEELFDAMGSPAVGRVVASIRASLSAPTEDASEEEEPPPPRRFTPPTTAAVRRKRPRPQPRITRTPVAAPTHKGSGSWLRASILIVAGAAVAAVAYYQFAPETPSPEPSGNPESERRVAAMSTAITIPTVVPEPSVSGDDFDPGEEEMARFTLEINLAESTLRTGDLHASLRHFAAAAAIDRFHRRVISMGKSLIAALLGEADEAGDSGDWELAGKRIEDARNIARGLRLDDSDVDTTAQKLATMTRFNDISPDDAQGLRNAIGRPVRLTLKTRDVIIGRLLEIDDGILLLDVYSGVKGGGVEFSTSILGSTIKEIRVYDARRPSEIMDGD